MTLKLAAPVQTPERVRELEEELHGEIMATAWRQTARNDRDGRARVWFSVVVWVCGPQWKRGDDHEQDAVRRLFLTDEQVEQLRAAGLTLGFEFLDEDNLYGREVFAYVDENPLLQAADAQLATA